MTWVPSRAFDSRGTHEPVKSVHRELPGIRQNCFSKQQDGASQHPNRRVGALVGHTITQSTARKDCNDQQHIYFEWNIPSCHLIMSKNKRYSLSALPCSQRMRCLFNCWIFWGFLLTIGTSTTSDVWQALSRNLRTTRRSRGGAARGGGTPSSTSKAPGSSARWWTSCLQLHRTLKPNRSSHTRYQYSLATAQTAARQLRLRAARQALLSHIFWLALTLYQVLLPKHQLVFMVRRQK